MIRAIVIKTIWMEILSLKNNTTKEISHLSNDVVFCDIEPMYRKSMISLFGVTFLLSFTENILLWYLVLANKKLRTRPNIYVISLSISDFVTTITIGWVEIYRMVVYPEWDFGMIGTSLYNTFWCFSLVTPFAHTTVITVECYMVIKSGHRHRKAMFRRTCLNLLLIWCYSIGITVIMAVHFDKPLSDAYEWNVQPEWYYPFLGVHLTVPLFLCSLLYLRILKIAKEVRQRVDTFQAISTCENMRLARTIAVVLIFLFLVWLPVNIIEILYAIMSHACVVSQLGSFSVWLTCSSGVINPIIFIWRNRRVRQTLYKKFFCCKTSNSNNVSFSSYQLYSKRYSWLPRRRQRMKLKVESTA